MLCVALLCLLIQARAQGTARFPAKPIRIIVAYPAGGPTDMTARSISPRMTEALGQPLVIDNRPGGSTIIATEMVVRAPPDGHTLLLVTSTIAVTPSTFKKLPYDVKRDLAPVTQAIASPFAVLAHPALPVHTAGELIALIKSRPSQLHYPSSGVGSSNHLAVVLLSRLAKIEPTHVPYKGTAQGITDLVAGHMQFSLNNPLTSLPLVRAGKLRLLATTGTRRLTLLPRVPTVSETVPGYEAGNWHALFAPGGTRRISLLACKPKPRAHWPRPKCVLGSLMAAWIRSAARRRNLRFTSRASAQSGRKRCVRRVYAWNSREQVFSLTFIMAVITMPGRDKLEGYS